MKLGIQLYPVRDCLDICGGGDPLDYIRRYAGRVPQVHAKDDHRADRRLVEIGRGDLDFSAIATVSRDAGAGWLIYELDASTLGDSLASAREATAILRPLV